MRCSVVLPMGPMNRALSRFFCEAAKHDTFTIFLLAAVVAGFFLPSLVTPGVLIWPHSGLGSDISYRHWPDLIGYASNWTTGRIALWDSRLVLGRPLAGDTTVLFLYPFDILFAVMPPALAFNSLDAMHVFLAGLFMFLLLRLGYGTARPAALLGALASAFGPKFISHLAGGQVGVVWGFTWAPAVLLGLKLAFDGWPLGAALGGLALALQMPTHLQMPYYTGAIGSAFWLWHVGPPLWQALRGERSEWKRVRWLAAMYAIWLASFALLAAAVLLPLLELLPFNSRAHFSLTDANLYALPPALLITLLVPSNFQFPEWTMFVGLLPLLLTLVAWLGRRQKTVWFFTLLAGFALLYSLGTSTPLMRMSIAVIPGFRMLRVPTRLWFFGGLAIAVLAGFGADSLSDGELRHRLRQRMRWLALATSVCFAGGVLAWVGYWVVLRQWHGPMSLRLLTAALVAGAGVIWLKGRVSGRIFQWLLISILLVDLLPLASAQINLVDPHSTFLRSTPALDFVSAQAGIFRVYSPAGDLPYAVAASRNVETLEGLLAFQIGTAVRAIREATGCAGANYATAIPPCLTDRTPTAVPDAERLGRLNVRYVLSHYPLADPNFQLVMNGAPAVYENMLWQPRVRVTPAGTAEIVNRRAGEYTVSVSVPESAHLIVSETWLSGWHATVDGQPRSVERVEDALIGLALEAGQHQVRFHYSPLGWRIGWPVSIGGLIGLAMWVASAAWRTGRRQHV